MHQQSAPLGATKPVIQLGKMQTCPDELHSPASSVPGSEEVPWRIREIAMLRGLGYSYREIAGPLGVTPQAVSIVLSRHRRSLTSLRGAMELNSLPARAVNVLGRHGICTREQARQANVLERLAGERNCGRKTMDEIAWWMEEDSEHPASSNGRSSAGHDLHHV